MEIFTLFKKPVNLLAVCLSMSLCSCVDNEEEAYASSYNTSPNIEVSEMGKWLSGTRNASDADSNMPVLHFKNEQVYNQTIAKLNGMSIRRKGLHISKNLALTVLMRFGVRQTKNSTDIR